MFIQFCFVRILISQAQMIFSSTVNRVSVLLWFTLACLAKCYNTMWAVLVSCKQLEIFLCSFAFYLWAKQIFRATKQEGFFGFFSQKPARRKLVKLQHVLLEWGYWCFHSKRRRINLYPTGITRCRGSSRHSFISNMLLILGAIQLPLVSQAIWTPCSVFKQLTSLQPDRVNHFLLLSAPGVYRRCKGDFSPVRFKAAVCTKSRSSTISLGVRFFSLSWHILFYLQNAKQIPGHITDKQVRSWEPKSPSIKFERASFVSDIPYDFSSKKNSMFRCHRQTTVVNITAADQNSRAFRNSCGQKQQPYSPVTQRGEKTAKR